MQIYNYLIQSNKIMLSAAEEEEVVLCYRITLKINFRYTSAEIE